MKKILLLLLLTGFVLIAQAQIPLGVGYNKIYSRYTWLAGGMDSGFHLPGYATVPNKRTSVWTGSGNIGIDTVNHRQYFYSDSWIRLANFSEIGSAAWSLTGNATTTPGTNFLGTTDGQALQFRTNGALRLSLPATALQPGSSSDSILVKDGSSVIKTRAQSDVFNDTLYLLVSGQSNSNGFNDGLYDTARNTKVFGWNGAAWVVLQRGVAPMGWCFPENSVGTCGGTIVEDSATSAGFYLAKRLQERTGKIIRVIFNGYGGEVISNWIPASSTNFQKMLSYMTAIGDPHIDYFLWQHGEANGFDADTTYKRKVDTLIQQMDAQPWMGKDVPIFISTVRDTATHQTMYYTQIAMGSGLFDKRYTTIDAGKEPYYSPAPYHFSAEGEYNIANKIISTIYNKLSAPNSLRGVNAAQQTTMETFVANLGKPIITWDSTSKAINIQEINLLKTAITGGYLTLRETFDSYGAVDVNVRNSGNVTGLEIWNKGLDASGITFKTNTANEHRIVYQHDAGSVLAGNTSGEIQYFKPAVGNLFRVGEVVAAMQPKLYLGDATTVADSALTVGNGIWGKRGVRFSALPSSPTSAADLMVVQDTVTGIIGHRAIPTGGGGGAPEGNFGNLQIGRNGAFATPASDSLDFESATGLTVKGDINTTSGVKITGPIQAASGVQNLAMSITGGNGLIQSLNGGGGMSNLVIDGNEIQLRQPVAGVVGVFMNTGGKIGIYNQTSPTTTLHVGGNFAVQQGADVASTAGAMTLGTDGNSFEITGTNTITLLSNVGWINGSEVTLMFTSTATLTDGTANSGTDIGMELAGNANFVASAGATVKLLLSEIGGTQRWREVGRSVN